MSSLVLTGSTSGTVSVQAPAVAGSNTATIGAATGTHYPFTAGTAVASTSGTSIDFTSIPSWVKRITVIFSGVSTNGTTNSTFLVQLGDSGGIENTSYAAYSYNVSGPASNTYTTGFGVTTYSSPQANAFSGQMVISSVGSSNTWVASGVITGSPSATASIFAGNKALSDVLDRIRITTPNGTDTFDAGSINILYE